MNVISAAPRAKFGLIGFLLGVVALGIVVVQVSALFSEPEQSAAATIGEIAAEIRDSAKRALAGEPRPAPEPEPAGSAMELMALVPYVLAGLAVMMGGVGLYRSEPKPLSFLAISFGVGAFVMYYAMWMAIMICGVVLLVAIIQNIGEILGE